MPYLSVDAKDVCLPISISRVGLLCRLLPCTVLHVMPRVGAPVLQQSTLQEGQAGPDPEHLTKALRKHWHRSAQCFANSQIMRLLVAYCLGLLQVQHVRHARHSPAALPVCQAFADVCASAESPLQQWQLQPPAPQRRRLQAAGALLCSTQSAQAMTSQQVPSCICRPPYVEQGNAGMTASFNSICHVHHTTPLVRMDAPAKPHLLWPQCCCFCCC